MDDIKCIKLTDGEEIICKTNFNVTNNKVILSKPVKIMFTQEGLSMAPWLMFGELQDVEIDIAHILCCVPARDEIKNGYNANFGSGLVTAQSSIITPHV